jgi:hypothetical protein
MRLSVLCEQTLFPEIPTTFWLRTDKHLIGASFFTKRFALIARLVQDLVLQILVDGKTVLVLKPLEALGTDRKAVDVHMRIKFSLSLEPTLAYRILACHRIVSMRGAMCGQFFRSLELQATFGLVALMWSLIRVDHHMLVQLPSRFELCRAVFFLTLPWPC